MPIRYCTTGYIGKLLHIWLTLSDWICQIQSVETCLVVCRASDHGIPGQCYSNSIRRENTFVYFLGASTHGEETSLNFRLKYDILDVHDITMFVFPLNCVPISKNNSATGNRILRFSGSS